MKKIKNIFLVAATAVLAACSSEDLPVTHADGWDEIRFSVGTEATRADITYIPYDYERDPHTIGTFGYHDLGTTDEAQIFTNTEVTAALDEETSTVSWSYPNKKYWFDYAIYDSFDFFATMPYNDDATLVKDESQENTYTLSMPVTFDGAVFSPVETALLCAEPQHLDEAEGVIPFRMDQTLTGYALRFQLGDQMDELRDFIIKDVKVYGNSLAYSGTVSRSYTYAPTDENAVNGWVSGDITWSGVATKDLDPTVAKDVENIISIPYINNPQDSTSHADYYIDAWGADEEHEIAGVGALRVTSKLVQWGNPIYIIPNTAFNPTFEVIYDVVVQNEDGDDIITRKDVHSTIVFNTDNFGEQSLGEMGKVQPIRIKIVPDHLYVLADADQTFGYIVVSE